MKSRVLLPIVGIVSALVLFGAYVFRPMPTAISAENAAKIQIGMPYDDVEAILGFPRDEVHDEEIEMAGELIKLSGFANAGWRSESTHLRLRFRKGRVDDVNVEKTVFPSVWTHLHWRLRKSFGLPVDEIRWLRQSTPEDADESDDD